MIPPIIFTLRRRLEVAFSSNKVANAGACSNVIISQILRPSTLKATSHLEIERKITHPPTRRNIGSKSRKDE